MVPRAGFSGPWSRTLPRQSSSVEAEGKSYREYQQLKMF
jgi:hypothetical protein